MLHISPNDHVLTSPNPTLQFFTSTYRCIVLLVFIDQRRHVHLGVGGGGVVSITHLTTYIEPFGNADSEAIARETALK